MPEFTYDAHKSFRGWLRTVTMNKWRENGRKRARRPATTGAAALADLPAPADPEAFAEAEYRQHLVARALKVMRAEFADATWKACWEVTALELRATKVTAAGVAKLRAALPGCKLETDFGTFGPAPAP